MRPADNTDCLADTIKTRLMAYAEDFAFDNFQWDHHRTAKENLTERREQMFRAATAIARRVELDPDLDVLWLVELMDLSDEAAMRLIRGTFIPYVIYDHHRDEAERTAQTDSLTGLGNAHAFQRAMRSASTERAWFIALDLDRFKAINDNYGHAAGDAALREFARILQDVLQAHGLRSRAFRVGGDEFMVIVSGRRAHSTARHIVKELERMLPARLNEAEYFADGTGNQFPPAWFRETRLWFSAGVAESPRLADMELLGIKRRKHMADGDYTGR